MAKDKERRIAHEMFVHRNKTGKEIAGMVGVTEKTVGDWVAKGGWKEEKEARATSGTSGLENVRRVISNLAERILENAMERKTAVADNDRQLCHNLDKEAVALADQVSKMNKALENMDKANRINLAVYLDVMDDIFNNLRAFDEKLFMKTLDFQESHVQQVSKKLG